MSTHARMNRRLIRLARRMRPALEKSCKEREGQFSAMMVSGLLLCDDLTVGIVLTEIYGINPDNPDAILMETK